MKYQAARDDWLAELDMRGSSKKALEAYLRFTNEAGKHFAEHLKIPVSKITLEDITRATVIAALSKYKTRPDGRNGKQTERSPASVSGFHASIRSFFVWCVESDHLGRSPFTGIRAPKVPKTLPKALSVQDCAKLLTACEQGRWPSRDRLVILFALTMGLRLSEIASVHSEDFYPSICGPTQLTVHGKGAKERLVPVPGAIRDALEAYLPTRTGRLEASGATAGTLLISARSKDGRQDMCRDSLSQVFDTVVCRAGLKAPGVRAHMGRHSFATHTLRAGVTDLLGVSAVLGHASIATTQVYLQTDVGKLAAGVEANPLAHL